MNFDIETISIEQAVADANVLRGASDAVKKIGEKGFAALESNVTKIDANTLKTFDKVVKTLNSNPIDNRFLTTNGGYNGYATPIKYDGETFNAVKVFIKVKANTTLRVQLFDPAIFATDDSWWTRKPIKIGETYIKTDVAVKTSDRFVIVQLPITIEQSTFTLPYYYLSISTEEATTGVMLAVHDVVIDTARDKGGYSDRYSVIDTQKNTNSGFRYYTTTEKLNAFYAELIHLNHDGVRTESIEDTLIDRPSISSNFVQYPNFYNCENIESHLYFRNFQKSLIKPYGYKYLCYPYGLSLAGSLRVGIQEDERLIKYNKALVMGNKNEIANVNFFDEYYQDTEATVPFNHITVAASNGSGQTCNIVCVGESTTAGGEMTQRLLDIEATDVLTLNCAGTRGTGVNKHEGVGGKTMTWHLNDVDSAFTSATNTFNYPAFITAIGGVIPNIVSIQIGINAMLSVMNKYDLSTKIATEMASYTTFINNIKASQPTTKFIVNTCILPNEKQSAFAKNYDTFLSRDFYRESVQAYNEALIALFKDRESEGIYLNCTQTLGLDCVNAYTSEPILLSEHTTITESRGAINSGVHPSTYGYKLMGDALWACIKYIYKA